MINIYSLTRNMSLKAIMKAHMQFFHDQVFQIIEPALQSTKRRLREQGNTIDHNGK